MECLTCKGHQFATLLKKHPRLAVLTLQDLHIDDKAWKTAFDAIKLLKGI